MVAVPAPPLDLRHLSLGCKGFAVACPLALLDSASYPVRVPRRAGSLAAAFSRPLAVAALRFAWVATTNSPEDSHLQVTIHAGHTSRWLRLVSRSLWSVLHGFCFLPRLSIGLLRWSRRSWGHVCPDQFGVGEALTDDAGDRVNEPGNILGLTVIEAEHLLIEVPKQMKWFDRNVGALNATLQQAPEVLQPVGMDGPLGVALGMVNDLMDELLIQLLVGVEIVSENLRPRLAGGVDCPMQGAAADTAKDASAYTAGLTVEAVTAPASR